ncbi:MAG: hypothetical protein HOA16_03245 [Opitutae bacterium]|nr:hypothetical protein [Opitutae bacterium]
MICSSSKVLSEVSILGLAKRLPRTRRPPESTSSRSAPEGGPATPKRRRAGGRVSVFLSGFSFSRWNQQPKDERQSQYRYCRHAERPEGVSGDLGHLARPDHRSYGECGRDEEQETDHPPPPFLQHMATAQRNEEATADRPRYFAAVTIGPKSKLGGEPS